MGQKLQSPSRKVPEDNFQFASLLHPQPASPRTLDLMTVTPTPSSPSPRSTLRRRAEDQNEGDEEKGEDRKVVKRLLSSGPAGRVKSMIDAIEHDQRSRSKTLPSLISESLSDPNTDHHHLHDLHAHSEGASPAESAVVLNGHKVTEIRQRVRVTNNGRDSPAPACHSAGSNNTLPQHISVIVNEQRDHSPTKLNAVLDISMEDSASYVRVHPLPIGELGGMVEEELDEEVRRRRRMGVVATSPVIQLDDEHELNSSESTPTKDTSRLKEDGEIVEDMRRSPSSSPGVDNMSDDLDSAPIDPQQSDSLQNLYHAEDGNASPHQERKKKKRKWRLFKKRKSTEDKIDGKNRRSQSDAPGEFEGVEFRDKQRSRSHNMVLGREVGGARGRKQVDCYTIYMQDYSAKLEERKRLSPSRDERERPSMANDSEDIDRASTDDDMNRGDATPPAEMSPLAFKQSLYCQQLKFKLRSALQNIHSSLSLSHAHVQLQEEGGVASNVRYHLIVLIQHALQRSHWAHRDMETALLSEILRMVEPLPNEL